REIDSEVLRKYLPEESMSRLPVLYDKKQEHGSYSDRDLLYKVLFDMKKDITDLKKVVVEIMREGDGVPSNLGKSNSQLIREYYENTDDFSNLDEEDDNPYESSNISLMEKPEEEHHPIHDSEIVEESLSLQKKEVDFIKKALEKHQGKRKDAAKDLGISERTLYRKIKEYNIK
ncbi:MAG TPA: helix-turn-helix domain-containing protein, partial [Bacteroidales bacterium]|nr:helix-turn-helix domain-containing protein [Bacteroidales bacterium]